MKNSRDYAKKIQKLYGSLRRKYRKVERPVYDDPVDAVVYGIISEHLTAKEAQAAMRHFGEFFVDLNDMRVSREEEIMEMIGQESPTGRRVASIVTKVLRNIFDKYHQVSLEPLKKMGKRPARSILEKTDGISRFVADYCLLTALGGHAIPLTAGMLDYLRARELVHPEADDHDIAGFLARQIAARNGYEFYELLRRASESARKAAPKKKTKTAAKAKPKTKTKKKIKRPTKKKTKPRLKTKKKKK